MLFHLLKEPVIRFGTVDGQTQGSLPEVYEALMSDTVTSFPALRPHQRHAWHALLVQLGTLGLWEIGASGPPSDAASWAGVLREFTHEYPQGEPWHLVVDDITLPAFLQPPATSEDRRADYKHAVDTPDALDMLRTAKNHDLKAAVATSGLADDWLFALLHGPDLRWVQRGAELWGFPHERRVGQPPGILTGPRWRGGAHVRRDITVLLDSREELLEAFPRSNPHHKLLWTLPWDGQKGEGLFPDDLDPLYVEICRRIRLHADLEGRLGAKRASSKEARVASGQLKGRTGDPWTPVNTKENKSLTLPVGGFTYRRVVDYLTSGDWQWPVLLKPTAEESAGGDMRLVARAMVRGQGKTEGYYERSVPMRSRTVRTLGTGVGMETIGKISGERIKEIGVVQRILSHAIRIFLARGRAKKVRPEDRERARRWLDQLDAAVDAGFFDGLQSEFETSAEGRPGVRRSWLLGVVNTARVLLSDAVGTLPCPSAHRYRARSSAEALFEGSLRAPKGLPSLFTEDKT